MIRRVKNVLSNPLQRVRVALLQGAGQKAISEAYVTKAPSPQTAVDIFEGDWATALPPPLTGHRAGPLPLFHDERLMWALKLMGGVVGRSVLELGPLEGAHTYLMDKLGARDITAIEANPRAYLKCLVFKEVTRMRRAQFLCGDFMEYLRETRLRFDVAVGSGVLYHMSSPLELIARLARVADIVYLWTHYYDEGRVRTLPHLERRFADPVAQSFEGFTATVHPHYYFVDRFRSDFFGGPASYSCWLTRDSILAACAHFGFTDIQVGCEEPDHKFAQALALVARRETFRAARTLEADSEPTNGSS
jgi:hypothetical protein